MRLPHQIHDGCTRWTFTLGGVDRREASQSAESGEEPDMVFLRFESADSRFGTISVWQRELGTIDDLELMRRVRAAAHEKRSPDRGTYGT